MRVPIENKGKMPLYVGGVMIPPGETRHFEDDLLPPEFRSSAPVVAEVDAGDPLAELLEGNVAEVTAGLEGLSDELLARLAGMEAEGKARKGVLAAIAEAQLRRAEALAGGPATEAGDSGA